MEEYKSKVYTVDYIREAIIKEIKKAGFNVKSFSESQLAEELLGKDTKHLRSYLTRKGKRQSLRVFNILCEHFNIGTFVKKERRITIVEYIKE